MDLRGACARERGGMPKRTTRLSPRDNVAPDVRDVRAALRSRRFDQLMERRRRICVGRRVARCCERRCRRHGFDCAPCAARRADEHEHRHEPTPRASIRVAVRKHFSANRPVSRPRLFASDREHRRREHRPTSERPSERLGVLEGATAERFLVDRPVESRVAILGKSHERTDRHELREQARCER